MDHRKNELLGWAIFMVGFLVAAATSMRIPPVWGLFIPGLVVSVVGAVMARHFASLSQGDEEGGGPGGEDGEEEPREALPMLKAILKHLDGIDPEADSETIQAKIEQLQEGLITDFVAARRGFLLSYGPITFAHFFGAFAKGERSVNRAWSALVDLHRPEMQSSLVAARAAIQEAHDTLGAELKTRKLEKE